eukprot:1150195-Pelagomonas_calceolata.AAC.3
MSDDENPNKKTRVPKGMSDGAYKLKLGAVRPTNKFQATWFKDPPADGQPRREHWLVDKGAGKGGQLMAGCSLCDVIFQCHSPFPTAKEFWKQAENLGACQRLWVKLAKLVMVMVPGSVKDEHMYSAKKCLWNPKNNSLKQQHLTCCARGFKSRV